MNTNIFSKYNNSNKPIIGLVSYDDLFDLPKPDNSGEDGLDGKSVYVVSYSFTLLGDTEVLFSDGNTIIVKKGTKGDTGNSGTNGLAPEHQWSGTSLRFKNPNNSWGNYTNLKGNKGDKGDVGETGTSIEVVSYSFDEVGNTNILFSDSSTVKVLRGEQGLDSYLFTNGLVQSAGIAKLGGSLTENTTIDTNSYSIVLGNNTKSLRYNQFNAGNLFLIDEKDSELSFAISNSSTGINASINYGFLNDTAAYGLSFSYYSSNYNTPSYAALGNQAELKWWAKGNILHTNNQGLDFWYGNPTTLSYTKSLSMYNNKVGIGNFTTPSTDINSTFHLKGSYSTSGYSGKTDNYTLTADDYIVTFYLASINRTCTVPAYNTTNFGAGKRFIIKNSSSSTGNLTVQLSGSDKFDNGTLGASSLILTPNQSVEIISYNTGIWSVISSVISATGLPAYTATSPLSISGTNVISMTAASATDSGFITTGTQTFAGQKTFNSNVNIPTATLFLGNGTNKSSFEDGVLRICGNSVNILDLRNNGADFSIISGKYSGVGIPLKLQTSSNFEQLVLNQNNSVSLSSLAGTGTRIVTADATGTLSSVVNNFTTGSGTLNYIPKWSSTSGLTNSLIYDNGTFVGVNNTVTFGANFLFQVGGSGIFKIDSPNTQNLIVENTNAASTAGVAISLLNQLGKDVTIFNDNSSITSYIGTNSNHPFAIRANSLNRIHIDANGLVSVNAAVTYARFNVNTDTYGTTSNLLSLGITDGTYNPRVIVSYTTAVGQPARLTFDSTFTSGWGATNYSFATGNFSIGSNTFTSLFNVGTSGQFKVSSTGAVSIDTSASGSAVTQLIRNTSNTALSNAAINIVQGGTSAGAAVISFGVSGARSYVMGIDNDQSFKLNHTSSSVSPSGLTGNNILTVNASGNVSIGSSTIISLFNVGSSAQFQVSSVGNITTSGSVTLSAFTVNGGLLYTNGSGLLTQTTATATATTLAGFSSITSTSFVGTLTGSATSLTMTNVPNVVGGTDLNTVTSSIFVNYAATGYWKNTPLSSSYGFAYTQKLNTSTAFQFYYDIRHLSTDYGDLYFRTLNNTTTWAGWAKIWHSLNDGSGSGLDSDLLDGQQGTYYLSRTNHTGTQLASTISDFNSTAIGLLSSTATGLTYTNTTGVFSLTSGYIIPTTTEQSNWNTAFADRNKWDGGATGLVATTGRTSLGATTVGSNLFTLINPSAITFIRINADNTVSALDATSFRTAIGAGTSTVTPSALTKVDDTNVTLTLGGTPTTSLLQSVSLTLGWTGTLADSRIASSANWNTAYTNRITSLTTTGNSGAATLIANVLNIPTYTLSGLGGVSGTGTTNYLSKWSSTSGLTNSLAFDSGTGISIGSTTTTSLFNVGTSSQFQVGNTGNVLTSGTLTANQIIKSGGTSTQFLKADGSIDSSSYLSATNIVQNKTTNYTITAAETGNTFTDIGAGAGINLTLPTPVVGLTYTFILKDQPSTDRIYASTGTTIRIGTTSTKSGGYINALVPYSITVRAISTTEWMLIATNDITVITVN